jgi:molecular chaperone GrpE
MSGRDPGAGVDEAQLTAEEAGDDRDVAAPAAAAEGEAFDAPEAEVRTVEDLLDQLEAVIAERDQYLALARERQAEFENYRKQTMKRQAEHLEQATSKLVEQLLVVLDAFDSGVAHGEDALVPLRSQLFGVLEREGLQRIDPGGEPFDPALHEAVLHEPADGTEGPVVEDVMRSGYVFNGRVLRPAMVKVKG